MPMNAQDLKEARDLNLLFMQADRHGELYEDITLALYSGVLGPGDSAVDCGMNMGQHTRAMARAVGDQGVVFGFEAAPATMAIARDHLQTFQNIRFFQNAAWHASGQTLTFNYSAFAHGLSTLKVRNTDFAYEQIAVRTLRIDDAVDRPVSLIKLDIEGAEQSALRGAQRVMREDRPVIVFENELVTAAQNFGYSKDDFFALFYGCGYNIYTIGGQPVLPEHWGVEATPFQFMALHPASPRTPRAFAVTQSYVARLRSNVR